jgi:O-antigen ligase
MSVTVRRRLPLDLAVPVVLAATVLAFAAGSSSVATANRVGHPARWALLVVLAALAVAWAARTRAAALPARPVLAGAGALAAAACLSVAWSVQPRLSAERAGTLVVLLVAAAALAVAAAGSQERLERVLGGLLAGAACVAVAGLVVLAFAHRTAVEPATYDLPWRYKGFGENPDTASLLFALALPVALWFAVRGRGAGRAASAALALLFVGSITASGSRGALVAAFVGAFAAAVAVPLHVRGRAVAVAAVGVLLAGALVGVRIPKPTWRVPAASAPRTVTSRGNPKYIDADRALPFWFDIGTRVGEGAPTQTRGLFGSSGRSLAWRGALDLADRRPVAGYGFGTEGNVFVDRWALFQGDLVENSYIGLYLQLGAVGLAAFLAAALAALATAGRRLAGPAAACFAAVLAGLALAVFQSYVYSVGNIGTAFFWICLLLGAAAVPRLREGA